MNTPRKWAKEIKAWADGAEIECRSKMAVLNGEWSAWYTPAGIPSWFENDVYEYRVKPKTLTQLYVLKNGNSGAMSYVTAILSDNMADKCIGTIKVEPYTPE